ncbi:Uncharacterized protein AC505_2657 [Pseudomonas syringae pv. maculicola]|nr:Uncharacterized protein AC505_2657 [Pseudomonas syringae pv. maculicola]
MFELGRVSGTAHKTTCARRARHTEALRKKKATVPFFIIDARITPKYFKNDVAQRLQGVWRSLRGVQDAESFTPFVGFVTERLRIVYTRAPKKPRTQREAQKQCKLLVAGR